MNKSDESYLFKTILIGDSGTGKSCLLLRYTNNTFNESQGSGSTVGVEFGSKTHLINGTVIKNHVWDTAGQERFKAVIKSYYRNTTIVFFVFDMTNISSFVNIKKWLTELETHGNNPSIHKVLIGNKFDLHEYREVTTNEASEYSKKNNMIYYETSAKTGAGINTAFVESFKIIIEKINSGDIDLELNKDGVRKIYLGSPKNNDNRCCF